MRLLPIRLVFVLLLILASGCATLSPPSFAPDASYLKSGSEAAECARLFETLDQAVYRAEVSDVQEARIHGFPHLRVNRFLAGDWRPAADDPRFDDWARRLRGLDRDARGIEVVNLPQSVRAEFIPPGNDVDVLLTRVNDCGERLLETDLNSDERRDKLYQRASVPDAYRGFYRLAGLYPLTSIGFYAGVKSLQHEIEADFSVPPEAIPVRGRLLRYQPAAQVGASPDEVARILRRAYDNPLQIPDPDSADRARLLIAYAPLLEIDVIGEADRIGRPNFLSSDVAQLNTRTAIVYTRISHARFESKTLLQLNYIFWFPARPKKGAIDILAGHLDGITWRVTLDDDGSPLIYDSMHNCGCYHLFLPTDRLRPLESNRGFEEPLLSPQQLRSSFGHAVLRIASRTHYLQRVYFEPEQSNPEIAYRLEDYSTLRSLPSNDGGRRSLFGVDGLIPGSERPERWIFWPMGVPSAGAMRQWGHHATAFVGRRHFDEPGLIARYFERVSGR